MKLCWLTETVPRGPSCSCRPLHPLSYTSFPWKTSPFKQLVKRSSVVGDELLFFEGKKTRRLISNRIFQTSYCFRKGPKSQSLKRCDIIGIEGAISSEDGLSPVCTLDLQGTSKKWQVTIHDFTRRDVRPLYEVGKYVPHTLIGWEYREIRYVYVNKETNEMCPERKLFSNSIVINSIHPAIGAKGQVVESHRIRL